MDFNNSETKKNLMKAFAGESQARNRYTFAAKVAKEAGYDMIEKVFLFTAEQERAHGEVFYNHLKQCSGENICIEGCYPCDLSEDLNELLRMASHNEFEEYEDVYKEFACTARKEGFEKIAVDFEHIAGIEKVHGDRFMRLLTLLESNALYTDVKTKNWMCLNCGFIYEGVNVPKKCPVCLYEQGYYIHLEDAPYTSKDICQ